MVGSLMLAAAIGLQLLHRLWVSPRMKRAEGVDAYVDLVPAPEVTTPGRLLTDDDFPIG